MTETHRDREDTELCLMPRCMREPFRQGLCDKHYRMAYPEDTTGLRSHIVQENAAHPMSAASAKSRHEHECRKRAKQQDRLQAGLVLSSCHEVEFPDEQVLTADQVAKCFGIPPNLLGDPFHDLGLMDEEGLR